MEVKIKDGNGYVNAEWTIEDGVMVVSPKAVKFEPKDGDVVYAGGFFDFVFIYKDNLTAEAYYYAALSVKEGKIILPDGGHIGYVSQLRPVTEEEKQKLFQALSDKGYEWDSTKKELVKIKWRPREGEIYWSPVVNKAVFEAFDAQWSESLTGRARYDKGWCFKTEEECKEFCNRLNQAILEVKP